MSESVTVSVSAWQTPSQLRETTEPHSWSLGNSNTQFLASNQFLPSTQSVIVILVDCVYRYWFISVPFYEFLSPPLS